MKGDIKIQLNEINRLMKYDRSKTIIEQQKEPVGPRVDVGDISSTVIPNDIKVDGYGENSFVIKDFSGSEFGYPKNCNPDFVLDGDETKPAIKGYCIYKGFGDKKIYVNEKDKVIFITKTNELMTMWDELVTKYPSIDEWSDEKQNEFYDFLKEGYDFGTIRQIKSNSQIYVSRYKFNNGSWIYSGLFNRGGHSYNEPKVTRVKDGWEIFRHDLTQEYLNPYVFNTLDSVSEFLCGENSVLHDVWTLKIGNVMEYPLEEIACDLLSVILMCFGPFGIAASISIEAAHARVLYNKGEKFGAALSLILGMLPLVGDVTAMALRKLTSKIGITGFTKVIGVITNLFRFYSGELKTTQIVRSLLTLSKEERKVFFEICSRMSYYIDEMTSWTDILIDLGKGFDERGIKIVSESIEKIAKLFATNKSLVGFGRWILDAGGQISGVMSLLLGSRAIAQLTDNKVMTEEEILEILDEMTDEEFYNFMEEFAQSNSGSVEN